MESYYQNIPPQNDGFSCDSLDLQSLRVKGTKKRKYDKNPPEITNLEIATNGKFLDQSRMVFYEFMEMVRRSERNSSENAENLKGNVKIHPKYRKPLTREEIERMLELSVQMKKEWRRVPKYWSEEENFVLIYVVRQYCAMNKSTPFTISHKGWEFVSTILAKRTPAECKEKWMLLHHISVQAAPWTPEEEAVLRQLVIRNGPTKWTVIAKEVSKLSKAQSGVIRQGKQCRERWMNHLDPNINRGCWSEVEDKRLLEVVQKVGKKWSQVARIISDRTENAVKNRWNALHRKKGNSAGIQTEYQTSSVFESESTSNNGTQTSIPTFPEDLSSKWGLFERASIKGANPLSIEYQNIARLNGVLPGFGTHYADRSSSYLNMYNNLLKGIPQVHMGKHPNQIEIAISNIPSNSSRKADAMKGQLHCNITQTNTFYPCAPSGIHLDQKINSPSLFEIHMNEVATSQNEMSSKPNPKDDSSNTLKSLSYDDFFVDFNDPVY